MSNFNKRTTKAQFADVPFSELTVRPDGKIWHPVHGTTTPTSEVRTLLGQPQELRDAFAEQAARIRFVLDHQRVVTALVELGLNPRQARRAVVWLGGFEVTTQEGQGWLPIENRAFHPTPRREIGLPLRLGGGFLFLKDGAFVVEGNSSTNAENLWVGTL